MGNIIDMQFLPIKLPPVHVPPFFYKSTHIALDENHRGNCSGLMVPTSKILDIGSPPNIGVQLGQEYPNPSAYHSSGKPGLLFPT